MCEGQMKSLSTIRCSTQRGAMERHWLKRLQIANKKQSMHSEILSIKIQLLWLFQVIWISHL